MSDTIEKAKKDLPVIIKFVDELVDFTDDILSKSFKYNDNFELMTLCFISKQYEHLKSIKILVQSGLGKDACLIARSMVEGMCLLLWANNNPEKADLWSDFAKIEDYKTISLLEEEGKTINEIVKNDITDWLKINGHLFYTGKAKQNLKEGKELPNNPYRNAWYDSSIRDIFKITQHKDAQGEKLYKKIYNNSSKWIHWSIGGFDNLKKISDNEINYTVENIEDSATALAAGFQALLRTLEILNLHFNLNNERQIDSIKNRYVGSLGGVPADEKFPDKK